MGIDPMNNISNNNKNTLCSYIILTYLISLEELHSLEAPTSFVFQLQLEGGSNPLVSQATT
jgi:hypothetical protein